MRLIFAWRDLSIEGTFEIKCCISCVKGAVRIFSKATAVQHAVDKIRANSIHPGFVDTPMTKPGHSNNEIARVRLDATPLGRFGVPADIAMGCLYLASDEASWITGSELVIDGGVTAQ